MPEYDDNNIPPIEDLQKLVDAATPELKEITTKQHVKRAVSRGRVLALTEILLNSWAPLVATLDQELSPARVEQRKAQLAGLDNRAWVFYAADLIADDVDISTNQAERLKLAQKVRGHDAKLMLWAVPCFGDNPVLARTLRAISRGSGREDDANDVLRLVRMFKAHWSVATARQKEITKAYLAQATADATLQLKILQGQHNSPARKLANSAYVLWQSDYKDLMQLGRYLTWADEDSAQRFPGIHEPGKGGIAEAAPQNVEEGGEQGGEQDEDDVEEGFEDELEDENEEDLEDEEKLEDELEDGIEDEEPIELPDEN